VPPVRRRRSEDARVFAAGREMIPAGLMLAAGIPLLAAASHWLVRSASELAVRLRVPRVVVGVTPVAFGASIPEFVVGFPAAWKGRSAIAVGNIVGSNLFNILFVCNHTQH